MLLFVFWYCHKRGRETRLEKERLAAEDADGGPVSSASSVADDGDSIFGSKHLGESSTQDIAQEKPDPPLIISDGRPNEYDRSRATVNDMPSVKDLPSPAVPSTPKE